MDRARLDGWCEKGILGLVLAILVFGPLATGAVRPQDFLVIQGLTMGVALLWAIRVGLAPGWRLYWPPISWAVLLFTGYALVRYLQADIEFVARQEFLRVLAYALLFFAVLNNVTRKEAVHLVVLALIFLAMAISVYALYQWLTDSDRVWHFIRPATYSKRGSGTYICPNHLAGFLGMLLPLGLAYTLAGRLGTLTRVAVGYASLAMLAGIAVTVSRGGWAATILASLVFVLVKLRHRNYRLPAFLIGCLILLAGIGFASKTIFVQKRLEQIFDPGKEDSTGVRRQIWDGAAKMWRANPWLGVGPAHFDYRFREFRPEGLQGRPDRVHNDYLNTLADWGVAGFVLVAAAWVLLYWGVLRSWKYVQRAPNEIVLDPDDRFSYQSNRAAFVLGAALGLFALLVHSFVDFNLHVPANAILAVTLMALLTGHFRFATERYWVAPGRLCRMIVVLVVLAGVGYLGQQGWRRVRELAWLDRAEQWKAMPGQRAGLLFLAHAVEPMNFETAYALGETLRAQSWQGNEDYVALAEAALPWFQRGIELNRYEPYNYLRYGMCLHWLGRHDEAGPYFEKAGRRDPNGYYLVAHQGWHRFQLGAQYAARGESQAAREQFLAAQPWFERSLQLTPYLTPNPIARTYLDIISRKLAELPSEPAKATLPPKHDGFVPN